MESNLTSASYLCCMVFKFFEMLDLSVSGDVARKIITAGLCGRLFIKIERFVTQASQVWS